MASPSPRKKLSRVVARSHRLHESAPPRARLSMTNLVEPLRVQYIDLHGAYLQDFLSNS
jgi:hypothetical protein